MIIVMWWLCTGSTSVMLAYMCVLLLWFFFQAEDGIRDLVRSRGLGDVYKRQDDAERNCEDPEQAPPVLTGYAAKGVQEFREGKFLSLIHI